MENLETKTNITEQLKTILICKTCRSWNISYWDNAEMCVTFDWGYYCNTCQCYIDPYDDVESVEDTMNMI